MKSPGQQFASARVPYQFLVPQGDGQFNDADSVIADLIKNPNEFMTEYDVKEATFSFVELAGTASDLMLFLWRRIPADRLDAVRGDRDVLDRYFTLVPPV